MPSGLSIALKLYGPFLLSIVAFATIFLVKKTEGGTVTIRPLGPLSDFAEFKLPISSVKATRAILIFMTIVPLFSPLVMDFSSFFPPELKMEVFYDEVGIQESLSQFDQAEISSLAIPLNHVQYQIKYYQDLDAEVKRILGIPQFFYTQGGLIHSSGRTSFVVEKIEGIQKYHVTESEGELLHILELPNEPPRQFKTFFEKLTTKDDYINPTIWHLLTKPSIILKSQFKQYLAQNMRAEGVLFHHTVVGVTKVTIYPWPDFSNTIYFANFSHVGLVPIAYAIYR